jgi:hypothetical protein
VGEQLPLAFAFNRHLAPNDGCNMPHRFLILVLGVLVRIVLIIIPVVTLVCCVIMLVGIF